MDALTKISFKKHPFVFHQQQQQQQQQQKRPCFSSISFKTQSFQHFISCSSFKIRPFSISSKTTQKTYPKTTQKQNPLLSLFKTPICVAVTATALFFSTFTHPPLLALASPPPPAQVIETEEQQNDVVSDEEKERFLEQQLSTNPDDVEALRSLMEIKIKKKKLPEAVEVINRLIELDPNEIEWPLLKAHMYSYMGESELAKAGFEDILNKDPLRVEAFHGLVMAVSQGGEEEGGKELDEVTKRIQEAMEKCRKEKKKDEIRDFKLLIAQIRVIEGSYNEALKVYQELVKEEPRDFRPYLCQGIIYTLLRKKDEAAKQFETYKRLVPKGHPYASYFDDNMLATKVFSQMAENERVKVGSKV